MHEYAIAEGVIGVAEANAAGRRIAAIDLRVGHLRQVVPSALEFSFQFASQGTLAEGAELRVTHVAPRLTCAACGRESVVEELPLACGSCGAFDVAVVAVVAGEELEVESIEVVTEAEAPAAEREVV